MLQQNPADGKRILFELCQQSEEAIFDDDNAYKSFFEEDTKEIEEEPTKESQAEEEATNHFNSIFEDVQVEAEQLEDVYEDF